MRSGGKGILICLADEARHCKGTRADASFKEWEGLLRVESWWGRYALDEGNSMREDMVMGKHTAYLESME